MSRGDPALSWDSGYWGRFTLATITRPNANAFPYTQSGERQWLSHQNSQGWVYHSGPPTPAKRLAELIRPNEDSYPYTLRPKGWSRSNDPFVVEARKRIAEGTA